MFSQSIPGFESFLAVQTDQFIEFLLENFEEFVDEDKVVRSTDVGVVIQIHMLKQVVRLLIESFLTKQAVSDLAVVGTFFPLLLQERLENFMLFFAVKDLVFVQGFRQHEGPIDFCSLNRSVEP